MYFVAFIDDFSRCILLFLIKNKYELFPNFEQFYQEIQTLFGMSILTLKVIIPVNIYSIFF